VLLNVIITKENVHYKRNRFILKIADVVKFFPIFQGAKEQTFMFTGIRKKQTSCIKDS